MENENKNLNEKNLKEELAPMQEAVTEETAAQEPAIENLQKPKRKKKFVKPLVICSSILLVLAVLAIAAYALLSYFVLFPNFASALGNTFESKLDIGTEFKLSDMLDGGKITVEAEGMDGKTEDMSFTLSYNNDGYVANTVLDRYEIDIAMTEKGMAYSSNKLNDGTPYGIAFKDIEDTLENSPLYYRNDGDYALTKDEFKAKLKELQALAEDDKQVKKDLLVLYSEISKAFEDSAISEYKASYGGIKVNGETRSARAQVYSFNTKDVTKFLGNVAKRFEDPSSKVEDAVDRLAKTEIFEFIASYIGYTVDDSEDLAELFDKLADSIKANFDGAKFDMVVGYVGRSVSIIQFKITDGEDTSVITLDFGENPRREYEMELSLVSVKKNSKTKMAIKYDVTDTDNGKRAIVSIGNYVYTDSREGFYEMNGNEFYLDFNEKDEEVAFLAKTVEEIFDENLEKPAVWKTTNMEVLFEYTDSRDELVLELKKVTVDTKDKTPKGDYVITVSTKPDKVKLPKYERVFELSERDYKDYKEEVADFLKKLKTDESSEMIPAEFDISRYFK